MEQGQRRGSEGLAWAVREGMPLSQFLGCGQRMLGRGSLCAPGVDITSGGRGLLSSRPLCTCNRRIGAGSCSSDMQRAAWHSRTVLCDWRVSHLDGVTLAGADFRHYV